jgi:hypothetical protein
MAFLDKVVTVSDAASLYLDANGIRTRFWHLTIDGLERAARTVHLHSSHLSHHNLSRILMCVREA